LLPPFLRYVPFFLACEQFALPKAANAMEVMTLRGLGQEIVAKCSGSTQKKKNLPGYKNVLLKIWLGYMKGYQNIYN